MIHIMQRFWMERQEANRSPSLNGTFDKIAYKAGGTSQYLIQLINRVTWKKSEEWGRDERDCNLNTETIANSGELTTK